MIQEIIVALIIAACVLFVARAIIRSRRDSDGCTGCPGCKSCHNCDDAHRSRKRR